MGSAEVAKFRSKLGPFMFVGVALVVLAPFNIGRTFLGVWGLFAVLPAYRYALLWSAGYDWHDVFRQPRHRLFMDQVSELGDEVQAFWNPKKRVEVRERHVARLSAPGMFSPVPSTSSPAAGTAAAHTAASAGVVRERTARRRHPPRERRLQRDRPARRVAAEVRPRAGFPK